MTRALQAKLARYRMRLDANRHAMLEGIRFGNADLAGSCAEMAAHYARKIEAAQAVQTEPSTSTSSSPCCDGVAFHNSNCGKVR